VRAQFRAAYGIGEELLLLAEKVGDFNLLLQAHQALGDSLYEMGQFELARKHLEAGLTLCNRERLKALGVDMEVAFRSYLARTLWFLGYPQQALEMNREAVSVAKQLSDPFSLVFAEHFLSNLHQLRGEVAAFRDTSEREIRMCAEHGFVYCLAHATINRGIAMAEEGRGPEAVVLIKQGFAAATATGAEVHRVDFLHGLTEAYSATGSLDDALDTLTKAFTIAQESDDLYISAELYRLKGELLLRRDFSNSSEAYECFQSGIRTSRDQEARSLELRLTTSLARLLARQGRDEEAHATLAAIYNWFTEGFDTLDLIEAKALLDELS
jgi:predicted ATPase